MNRSQLEQDMKKSIGASWCTRTELANYMGYKDPHNVARFTYNCIRVGNKYPIAEVAERIMERSAIEVEEKARR